MQDVELNEGGGGGSFLPKTKKRKKEGYETIVQVSTFIFRMHSCLFSNAHNLLNCAVSYHLKGKFVLLNMYKICNIIFIEANLRCLKSMILQGISHDFHYTNQLFCY